MQVLQEYLEQKHNITMIKQTDIEQGVDAFASDYDIQFTTPQGAADEQVCVYKGGGSTQARARVFPCTCRLLYCH